MGLQPKDLISTLPRLHENTQGTSSPLTSSPPSHTPSPPRGLPMPTRERSFTDGTSLASYSSQSESSPPPVGSVPISTEKKGFKIVKRKKKSGSVSNSVDQYARSRAETVELRRDHFVSFEAAPKCSDKSCRKRFRFGDRRRNCRMCGEVFCRKCTKFMRKLSSNADPDPLGTFRNVCESCYNVSVRSGRYRDLKHDFSVLREEAKRKAEAKLAAQGSAPLPTQPSSKSKSERVRAEIDRLLKGYERQSGLVGVLGTPSWQKSGDWTPDSKVGECFNPACKKRFRIGLRKTNCRVCGQVFCRECAKNEIILYCMFKDSSASWAINGKEGGPTSKPTRFETYPICTFCCDELEEIILSQIDGPKSPASANQLEETVQTTCMDDIAALQAELATLQRNIEDYLPLYQRLTDTLNIEDSSPRTVQEDHPLRTLAKAQADLSDTLTHMANRSQALRNLSPPTETQELLLKHIMTSTFNFYQEYMFLFKSAQLKLREMVPIESLALIQALLDQQSMERVHIALRQLSFEVINVEKVYKCRLDFTECLIEADISIEKELRPVLEEKGESWDTHLECVSECVKDGFKNRPFVKLDRSLSRNGGNFKMYVRYVTVDRTEYVLSRCLRELDAKTREEAFLETKSSLARAGKRVSADLKKITDNFSPKK